MYRRNGSGGSETACMQGAWTRLEQLYSPEAHPTPTPASYTYTKRALAKRGP